MELKNKSLADEEQFGSCAYFIPESELIIKEEEKYSELWEKERTDVEEDK